MKHFKINKFNFDNAVKAYGDFLTSMGFEWESDPNMKDTPKRVIKSFRNDLWSGVYSEAPNVTSFENVDNYEGIVFQGDITINSVCSHHSLPFIGKAHVAYIPGKRVIGLSKLNRIVEWFARRPQVQENLTMQILNKIDEVAEGNGGVAVMIEANHMCACVRGVKHNSTMITAELTGAFKEDDAARNEFYKFVDRIKK